MFDAHIPLVRGRNSYKFIYILLAPLDLRLVLSLSKRGRLLTHGFWIQYFDMTNLTLSQAYLVLIVLLYFNCIFLQNDRFLILDVKPRNLRYTSARLEATK